MNIAFGLGLSGGGGEPIVEYVYAGSLAVDVYDTDVSVNISEDDLAVDISVSGDAIDILVSGDTEIDVSGEDLFVELGG